MVVSIKPAAPMPITPNQIIDDLHILIAVLSVDGTIQFVNGEVLRRTGSTREKIVGTHFSTAPWWTHVPGISADVDRAVQQAISGRSGRLEVDVQIVPGQRLLVEFEIRPMHDAGGTITALLVEGHDVSQQREVERKLKETQFRWRTIADFTVDWEFWLHPGGHFLYVSPSCERISGYSPDDFVQGRVTLSSIAHQQDKKVVLELMTKAFAGSTEHSQTWRLVRRDGGVRWVAMSWQPVRGEDGSFMGVRGSLRDVTQVMASQQELLRSMEAYRTLARHFPKGMVALFDHDWRFVVCDGPAFDSLPINAPELLGKRLVDVLDRDLRTKAESLMTSAMAGSEVADVVTAGDANWLVHLTPIRNAQGLVSQVIASAIESIEKNHFLDGERPTGPGQTV